MKNFGEKERTHLLARIFLKDELHWTGGIQHENMIGKIMGSGRDIHVIVTLRSMEDKYRILRNRDFFKDTSIYLNKDLTFTQQEQRRKEWEKVKSTREVGKWAWLKNRKGQVIDRVAHKK